MKRMRIIVLVLAAIGLCLGESQADPWKAKPMDWPHWRGPEMNGVSREVDLPDTWSPDGENLLWSNEDLGSRSTPIVMNGMLYMMVRDQPGTKLEGEKVVCVNAETGDIVWENRFNVFLSDVPDSRVAWSSVCGDPVTGRVYALGVCGYFQCLDGKTGKTIWSHSLSEKFGLLSTYGGRTNFPIVHGENVIISAIVIGWGDMAKPAHRFISFDKRNGQPVWFTGTRVLPYDTTYSSPILANINGQAAMIFGSGDGGVHAFQPRTGKNIWTYNVSRRGLNVTPLFYKNRVFAGHGEENIGTNTMGAFFGIDATKTGDITKTGELWRNMEWSIGKSSPLAIDDRVYIIDDKASLLVVDPENGELIGKQKLGTVQRSSPLYADGKIYTCTKNGRWYILKPTEDGVEVVHRLRLNQEESHGSPIVSHGRIYFPTTTALYCIGYDDAEPKADPRPVPPKETPIAKNKAVAHVQLVPCESLLRSGKKNQEQDFQVRLYNSNGQYLGEARGKEVKFSIEGVGKINDTGTYVSPTANIHSAITVTAKVGNIEGKARIRVVPELPWSFDFSDGQVPITWVGARYRHISIDLDVYNKLTKSQALAGQLYIYLMSSFINSGRNAIKFDNATPRQTWSATLRYLGLEEQANTLAEAKSKLDPALQLLVGEKVVKKWTWLTEEGAAGAFALAIERGPRKVDGNGVMVKIKTIPKGTRSQSWMGHTSFANYTFQVDVMGAMKDGKMPDVGLIGQRYTLDLMGASQQLQTRSWPPVLRMAKTTPFEWKPNTWYTMKFRAAVEGKKTVLRGKVWIRGEKEPAEWHVEAVDEVGNSSGSPGLFANASDAEVFYDNIKITPNK